MKTIITTIFNFSLVILLAYSATAQDIYDWSDPIPVTDSLTFNSQPSGWLVDYTEFGVFYEKRFCDTCNANIWYRSLTTMEPEKQIISGVANYESPLFYQSHNNNFKGYLIYLSDSLGNTEVFVSKIGNDFRITETTQLTHSTANESHLVLSTGSNTHYLGWLENQKAWISTIEYSNIEFTLSDSFVIDSGMINDYQLANSKAFFQKTEHDSLHIYCRSKEYQVGVGWYWDELFGIDTTGNNLDIEVCTGWEYMDFNDLLWVKGNSIHHYSEHSSPEINEYQTYNLPHIQSPSEVMWDWAVAKAFGQPGILVFSTGMDNASEIYSSFGDYGFEYDTVFVTKNNVPDRNPKVFWGEPTEPFSNWVYAVWESERNQHQPLYFAKIKAFIGSGIAEISTDNPLVMSVMPNPFTEKIKIKLTSLKNGNIILSVHSLTGKTVWNKIVNSQELETQYCYWVPEKHLPKGMYLLTGEQDGLKVTRQIVYR